MKHDPEITRLRSRWTPERVSTLRKLLPEDPFPGAWPKPPVTIPSLGLRTITHAGKEFLDLRGFPLAVLVRVQQSLLDFSFSKSPHNQHDVDVEIIVRECRLEDCRFLGVQTFQQVAGVFLRCNFSFARFREAQLYGSAFTDCAFEEADLRGAHMKTARGTIQSNADVSRFFSHCSFRKANLRKADFSGSILEDCDFRESLWGKSNLMRTTFINCDFRGVDLADSWRDERTRFDSCLVEGLTFKSHTRLFGQTFPVGPEE